MSKLNNPLLGFAMVAVSLLVISSRPAYADTITLSDGAFNNTDWTATKISDTTPSGTASFTASQVATGGNSGAYRETNHFYAGPGGLLVAHLRNDFVLTPASQGAILTLSFSFDARAFDFGESLAIGYGPLLFQNGSYYIFDAGSNVVANAWTSFGFNGLVASDFVLKAGSGSANPDFSATGAPITFGYYTANGTCCGPTSTRSGIDNYSVSIITAPAAVPEPTTFLLLGTGLAGIATRMRRREKALDKEV